MSAEFPDIQRAVAILRRGGLVAFPTETVYGLGADATSADAVRGIFRAKGRPTTNPLIAHVADASVAKRYAAHWPRDAQILADAFWPGPLTLVVNKVGAIVSEVSAGRHTVGLRAPDHPIAQSLLRAFDGPIAAPSANRSNRISPTTAEHVRRDLGAAVDLILDGGPCRVGIESTVLDLSSAQPTILRPGGVLAAQIEQLIGPVRSTQPVVREGEAASSPGQHAVHYAPIASTYRFAASDASALASWCRAHDHAATTFLVLRNGEPSRLLAPLASTHRRALELPADPVGYAAELYAALHDADAPGVTAIWIELPPDAAEWAAVRDRITRASRPWNGLQSG